MPEDRVAAAADATEGFERAIDSHRLLGHSNQRAKRAAGELLAIPAVTHRCACRVGLGCVAHCAAKAPSFDLHLNLLVLYFGSRSKPCCAYILPSRMAKRKLCRQPPGGGMGGTAKYCSTGFHSVLSPRGEHFRNHPSLHAPCSPAQRLIRVSWRDCRGTAPLLESNLILGFDYPHSASSTAVSSKRPQNANRIRLSGRRLANLTPAEIAMMPPSASGNPTSQSTLPASA